MVTKIADKVDFVTDRVEELRERMRAGSSHACAERSRLYTESWKQTEDEPLDVRYARMFEKFLTETTVSIKKDELIVGSQTKYVVGAAPFTEYNPDEPANVLRAERFVMRGETERGSITEEERRSLLEDCDFWVGKTPRSKFRRLARAIFGEKLDDIMQTGIMSVADGKPLQSGSVDFPKVLEKGLRGVIAEAEQARAEIRFTLPDDLEKYNFLSATIIALDAAITFARRHAALARDLARDEADVRRKQELEEIARVCERVPEYPAQSFHEALQSFWFVYLSSFLEATCTPGRLDQWLYPFYRNDIDTGRLTEGHAGELLACLWVKFNELTAFQTPFSREASQGQLFQYVTLGGVTPDGWDATNELSSLILEVARQLRLTQPAIAISYHPDMREEFLLQAVETNRDIGGGIPAFLNGDVSAKKLVGLGFSLEDARELYFHGCVHPYVNEKSMNIGSCMISVPKIFELALFDGVDPLTGKRIGPATGDMTKAQGLDELLEAFKAQFTYWIDLAAEILNVYVLNRMESCRAPFRSALMDDCIGRGRDVFRGGLHYHQEEVAVNLKGGQNVANSMVAIKNLVFDQKQLSTAELLEALRGNFAGQEDLRQRLLAQPKYGNDDDVVDGLYAEVWDFTGRVCQRAKLLPWTHPDSPVFIRRGGATNHYISGKTCGAFPDGRKAGEPMGDGNVSPVAGTDLKGPTAVINSASKLSPEATISSLFNMKFSPHLLRSDEHKRKLLALIKTYFERGGYHIQFNMINRETLLDAKAHPENYRDLVVRIGGFSAYFVELVPSVQDDIIARTEQGL
ncbi:MAG: hypothetical protein HY675_12475 [Chloroflexi bacterium]|nr:hypothetical protein [Chloroflexota bacterium]